MVTPPTFVAASSTAYSSTTTPKSTSGAFTAVVDDLLVAGILDADDNGTEVYGFSNGGGAQTWTKNPETTGVDHNDMWAQTAYAPVTSAVTAGAVTGTRTAGNNVNFWGLTALQFRDTDGIGTVERSVTAGGAPSFSVTTQFDNSALVVFLGDWNAAAAGTRTWKTINGFAPSSANGKELIYFNNSTQYTCLVGWYPDVGVAGVKTIGLDTPSTGDWTFAVIEVRGKTATSAAFSGWGIPL